MFIGIYLILNFNFCVLYNVNILTHGYTLYLSMPILKAQFDIFGYRIGNKNLFEAPRPGGSVGWSVVSHTEKVAGSSPDQGRRLGCRRIPIRGRVWEAMG